MSMLILKSGDGQTFKVDAKVAKMLITIDNMIQYLGISDSEREDPIPLPNVRGEALKKILEWAEHHKDDPPVNDDSNPAAWKTLDKIPEWDKEFLNVDDETLAEIMLAANYLDMKGLLMNCCKTVANMIRGKTPRQISERFGLTYGEPEGSEENKG